MRLALSYLLFIILLYSPLSEVLTLTKHVIDRRDNSDSVKETFKDM